MTVIRPKNQEERLSISLMNQMTDAGCAYETALSAVRSSFPNLDISRVIRLYDDQLAWWTFDVDDGGEE